MFLIEIVRAVNELSLTKFCVVHVYLIWHMVVESSEAELKMDQVAKMIVQTSLVSLFFRA